MRKVTYSMSMSLDGYVSGPDGDFNWSAPDVELFRFVTEQQRAVGVELMGRRLYETMLYWETADQDADLGPEELEWARVWKPMPKVVFSNTLSEVQGNARLATAGLADEIVLLRNEDAGAGDIAIGGPTLAAQAASLGLIDEYLIRVCPVLVGGGLRFFAHDSLFVDLERLEIRTFASGVTFLRYGVIR